MRIVLITSSAFFIASIMIPLSLNAITVQEVNRLMKETQKHIDENKFDLAQKNIDKLIKEKQSGKIGDLLDQLINKQGMFDREISEDFIDNIKNIEDINKQQVEIEKKLDDLKDEIERLENFIEKAKREKPSLRKIFEGLSA
jgi:hypothetical protein